MTTVAHPPKKGYRTIRLPLAESEYDRFLTDRFYAQDRLEALYGEFAELFPEAFPWGYSFFGFTEPSIKMQTLDHRRASHVAARIYLVFYDLSSRVSKKQCDRLRGAGHPFSPGHFVSSITYR